MPNLKRIGISITAYKCPNLLPANLKEVWLGPLKQLRAMEVFEVLVLESYVRLFELMIDRISGEKQSVIYYARLRFMLGKSP